MRLLPILATAGAVAALLVTSSSAQAFNTGAHYRATQEGLSAAGLSQGAIDRAHIANYQVDYKSNKPPATQFGKGEVVTRKAAYFHFDDLMTAWDVKRNLAWLDLAGRRMAEQAKEANDPGQALDGLGIALHALQDLYSHSNFADKDWPSLVGERVVTFDDVPEDLWMSPALANVYAPKQTTMLGIFSGNASAGLYGTPAHPEAPSWPEHGPDSVCAVSPECGINHDSVFRRDALTSQEMAILATKQWASKVRTWVGTPFWGRMRTYNADFVQSCIAKMQVTSSAAGQWGYAGDPAKWALRWNLISWKMPGGDDGCDSDWQDEQWSDVISDAYDFVAPDHFSQDDVTYPPESKPDFQIPVDPPYALSNYVGLFSVTWGKEQGLLAMGTSTGRVSATLRMGTGPLVSLGAATVSGNELRFEVPGGLSGTIYLMAQTKDAIAGYLRKADDGIPRGIYGSALVLQGPPQGPVGAH